MFKMETVDALDGQGKENSRTTGDYTGFPSISRQDQTKKRIFIQRNKPLVVRVPPTGREYDFRRTPDLDSVAPKKPVNGQIRPCIPADTPVDIERLHLNESPVLSKYRARERLDAGRCPTPMPADSEHNKRTEPSAPLPTARSAWDRTNAADVDDLTNMGDDFEPQTPRYPAGKMRDRAGRRFKPATKTNRYDIIMSDIDNEHSDFIPTPESPLNLTENVLQQYYHKPVNKDRRIARWLVDLQENSNNKLPAHLPDINSASRRNGALSFEEM